MNDILDNEFQEIDRKNFLSNIITKPRKVFRFLQDTQYDKYTYWLIVLSSIVNAFHNAFDDDIGNKYSLLVIIGMSLIKGALLGWIAFYLSSRLLYYGARLLEKNPKASKEDMLRVVAHAAVPTLAIAPLLVFLTVFYGRQFYTSGFGAISKIEYYSAVFYVLTMIVLTIWSAILTIIGVSETQKISIGRSILHIILPVILFIGVIFGVVLFLRMISFLFVN